ncbi:MAG TPA: 1-(5-phosphoribosyl)-5-[(5-phosphoribosylamino)methylideneamino]imidazole-4-carboxamide isomerase [Spirochaetota bacterium]|nr:1-(5-phosphoribosyl)-5-[(5-phosphoribosylamino)methylideneamino]imidazole-4-carboxamide isomerase [Spirochaetota bacterium]HQO01699.1 1-(5-phosphoribosyl)-5-[(5-phosphoribosylamino)methylideneamino]imidazole-4-carboxamide isomerase [Spirochaetota bacterium]
MLVIPAIDIRNGKCVRLIQGDPERETVYSDDPVSMAKRFEDMGARLIHVVDLDGAFEGYPVNRDLVIKIAQSVSIPIEIGGGNRTPEAIQDYVDAGIPRIILGTVVLKDEFADIVAQYDKYLVIGIDAKNSMVATHGWKNVSDVRAVDYIKELQKKGIREIIYTDISTDGMLTGPNYAAIDEVLSSGGGIRLTASGGISSMDDLRRLDEFSGRGLTGCITGKAVYDGRIDLGEAFSVFHK